MQDIKYTVVEMRKEEKQSCEFSEKRYVIVDGEGKTVDDAQGYGYKSVQKAQKAMWYKFGGGKQKIASKLTQSQHYWKDKKKISDAISDRMEINFKEIARGETTLEEIIVDVEKEFDVILDRKMVDELLNS